MERIRQVEQMPVYELFWQLALDVESSTRGFGPDFRWLRIQCLRSSESVCANMTEGFYSQYSTEYLQSLHRCRREARETMSHIRYAAAVTQLPTPIREDIITRYESACGQLSNLIGSIERKIGERGKSKDAAYTARDPSVEYRIEIEGTEYDAAPSGSTNHQPSAINH